MSTPKAVYSLKELRKQRGLTQKQLAEKTGIKARIISKLERHDFNGTYPDDVTRLVIHFGQTFTDLHCIEP